MSLPLKQLFLFSIFSYAFFLQQNIPLRIESFFDVRVQIYICVVLSIITLHLVTKNTQWTLSREPLPSLSQDNLNQLAAQKKKPLLFILIITIAAAIIFIFMGNQMTAPVAVFLGASLILLLLIALHFSNQKVSVIENIQTTEMKASLPIANFSLLQFVLYLLLTSVLVVNGMYFMIMGNLLIGIPSLFVGSILVQLPLIRKK
ncbi:MAG: hypothetical protein WCG84_01125 [Candidatus Moraniibacteriota bacterium]